ncbi:MAG: sensor histidine kinase [SAR324 cluster bacterium]|jgi:PAS domain S-box-containing protein|nr:histidine kinase [Deltaproteobacteria bacterium]MDP7335538.1 sensor histidine kinase [SAR324 cluster bacterium]MDP7500220.1 sensor histidine kinase [SAR324 cluster bacterium]|tara:strand:+ start:6021 stop:7685 length:1665 start_codon:yes stop_codon:yes gene_type:complete
MHVNSQSSSLGIQKMLPRSLGTRMLLLMMGLLILLVGATGFIGNQVVTGILNEYIGRTALNVSKTVSLTGVVQQGLKQLQSQEIQQYAERVRQATGASFVVVGDHEGKRYSHPVPERIGKYMVGGDNEQALVHGQSYISRAVGTLGPSLRGKVPIFSSAGKIIGVVSVGYLIETMRDVIQPYQQRLLLWIFGLFGVGALGTWLIAREVKRSIFGLEPYEIAGLYRERTALLESIREGIIAINEKGEVTVMNQQAAQILGFTPEEALGKPIEMMLPETRMLEVLKTGKGEHDQEMLIQEEEVIVNRVPILEQEHVSGVVSSFRRAQDIDRLVQELTSIREYSQALRAQTHEYSNKLHTLAGLIQIGATKEALELIGRESSGYNALLRQLSDQIQDPFLSAIIVGKYHRAMELKTQLELDPESWMSNIGHSSRSEKIVTILGNLIENALEASASEEGQKKVSLSMTDVGNELIFEVEDSGSGISEEQQKTIFDEGFSTKTGTGRGIGLQLVQKNLIQLDGHLTIGESSLGGARFTAYIPKTIINGESNEHPGPDRG